MHKKNKMRNKNTAQTLKYICSDFLSALSAWVLFFIFRKAAIESNFINISSIITLRDFYLGIIIIPFFWIFIYYLGGQYHNIYRKSRLKELGQTLFLSTIGVTLIFFVLILDDVVFSYKNYYQSFFFLSTSHFLLSYFPRFIITSLTIQKIRSQKINFPTLIVGSNRKALQLYKSINKMPKSAGMNPVGFITVNGDNKKLLDKYIPYCGKLDNLIDIINQYEIEEIIIAIEQSEREKIQQILIKAKATNVLIKAIPDLLDLLSHSVKISSIYGVSLVELPNEEMSIIEQNIKRLIDVSFSLIAITLLLPVFAFLMIKVKKSSKGPIFYSHKRIGRWGKEFSIYKFRSMYIDAEKDGPALSSSNDTRITPFGKFMRKMRLDEIPQFFNVLKGDMSIVGPRPERQFYIDQIAKKAPHYFLLLKVRPGITSWGQVKFGYAENVSQMIKRLEYDVIYLENMSLYLDFKIMIYTVKIILDAKGK